MELSTNTTVAANTKHQFAVAENNPCAFDAAVRSLRANTGYSKTKI